MKSRPTATYRVQFRNGTDFSAAAELAPYLRALGISHLYASPLTTAAPGSTHGYDVADFNAIDPVLGGMDGFVALSEALKANGIGLILDFVPNHMGATVANPWWRDVLEWGARSSYGEHFDIDWTAAKLVVPALGQPYGQALKEGLLELRFDAETGQIVFTYYDLRLPLTPPSYARILARIDEDPFPELARRFALAAPESGEAARAELAALAGDASVRRRIESALSETVADQAALHDLHEAQVWRLSYWRAAREGLTYRRFFEIADLVGIRVERPRVFDDAHQLLLSLIRDGHIQGVRLDHIDGLADPKSYLRRLQEAIGSQESPFYLLVEKILGPGEVLRPSWPVAGTTGYEFITSLAGLLVDPAGEAALSDAYARFLGSPVDYRAMVIDTKRRTLARNLAGELDFLKDLAASVAEQDPATRDYGADSLRRAIMEFAAAMPVYRTYVNVEGPDEVDLRLITDAVATVKATREVEDEGAVDFLARTLRLDFPDPELQAKAMIFAARFQQTTGPVMAKALEDTVFYRYNRLIALNEVGGEPDHFGASVESFHADMQARLETQPMGLSATATHDTKRGEDARARLYAISERPKSWAAAVERWSGMLSPLRREIDGGLAPDPEVEWLFYQALAGVWPPDLDPADADGRKSLGERMQTFMTKVVREAKARTSWASPAKDYEEAITGFTAGALDDRDFLRDFVAECEPLWRIGALNSLSQLALKLAAPGVPDIYQGTEFWDFSLVDPDNRRPVEYAPLKSFGQALADKPSGALMDNWRSGGPKMRLLRAGLYFRRDEPELFASGDYIPLQVDGERSGQVVAFARRHGDAAALVIAPVRVAALLDGEAAPFVPSAVWGNTAVHLPKGFPELSLTDAVTGEALAAGQTIRVSDALAKFPVALLRCTMA